MFNRKIYGVIIDNKYVGSDMYFGIGRIMSECGYKLKSIHMGECYTSVSVIGTKSRFRKLIKMLERNGYFLTLNESKSFALVQAA